MMAELMIRRSGLTEKRKSTRLASERYAGIANSLHPYVSQVLGGDELRL